MDARRLALLEHAQHLALVAAVAVDRLADQFLKSDRGGVLQQAKGLWKERDDLPDWQALRREWSRG